jgi:hypothetical protein
MPIDLKVTVAVDGRAAEAPGRVTDDLGLRGDRDEATVACAVQCFWQALQRAGLKPPMTLRPAPDNPPEHLPGDTFTLHGFPGEIDGTYRLREDGALQRVEPELG